MQSLVTHANSRRADSLFPFIAFLNSFVDCFLRKSELIQCDTLSTNTSFGIQLTQRMTSDLETSEYLRFHFWILTFSILPSMNFRCLCVMEKTFAFLFDHFMESKFHLSGKCMMLCFVGFDCTQRNLFHFGNCVKLASRIKRRIPTRMCSVCVWTLFWLTLIRSDIQCTEILFKMMSSECEKERRERIFVEFHLEMHECIGREYDPS